MLAMNVLPTEVVFVWKVKEVLPVAGLITEITVEGEENAGEGVNAVRHRITMVDTVSNAMNFDLFM
jgi:hypothetical protein